MSSSPGIRCLLSPPCTTRPLVFLAFLALCCRLSLGSVIIGEMLHGSSYRKRITLRNTGPSTASLVDYGLHILMNTPTRVVYRLNLTSYAIELESSKEYSICHSRSPETCDLYWGGLNFNGDDRIELRKSGEVVDVIGEYGGKHVIDGGWSVDGVPQATKNHLLVRKSDVDKGNTNWQQGAQTEWTVHSLQSEQTERIVHSPQGESTSAPAATVFDDDCWSIRSLLSDFPLDTCEQPTEKETVVIGTYNTLFLFDGKSDPRPQRYWRTTREAQIHLEKIADVVQRNHPDILTLAEVEDKEILQELVDEIEALDYTPYFIKGEDTYTGQDMGLITEGDIVANLTRTDCRSGEIPDSSCGASYDKTKGVSKNQIALFDSCLFGVKFALVSVHFYAFPNDPERCIHRESQARVIQDVIAQLMKAGFEVLVLGDLNDYSDLYEDVNPDSPRSRVLSMLRDPDNDGKDDLDNVMEFLPLKERYTAWWDKDSDDEYRGSSEGTQIDHILMTKGLFSRVRRAWVDHQPKAGDPSDHWPLFVELSTKQVTTA